MLAIRMQRTGRKGHAMFRVVVQDSRLTPTSGKIVAFLGSYDPHNKKATIVKDKAEFYLKNGARPSDRAAHILETEGVALPAWFTKAAEKKRTTKNPGKLRSNTPEEEKPVAETEEVSAEEAPESAAPESEATDEAPVEEAKA